MKNRNRSWQNRKINQIPHANIKKSVSLKKKNIFK